MKLRDKITLALAAGVSAAVALSAANPPSGAVWFVEIVWCLAYALGLAALFPRFRFSNFAYALAAFWCVLQAVGAHYTFEAVPFPRELFGLERNCFDRLAHFAVGLNAYLVCEYVFREKIVNGAKAAAAAGVFVIVAVAGLWEIVEWLYAAWDGGETSAAFLGSQGDEWDAQKDMLCDALGGLVAALLFLARERRQEK